MRALSLLLALPVFSFAEIATQPTGIDALAGFVGGEWVAERTFEKKKGGMVVVHEWGLNQKLVRSKSILVDETNARKTVYETIAAVHPQKGLIFTSYADWGEVYEGAIEFRAGALHYEFTAFTGTAENQYKQKIEFQGKDKYHWRLWKKSPEGWQELRAATFVRQPAQVP